ncbi:magnesium transporter MgtE [Flavobacteriaceae bacterium UJ101]|nr:magnesium transporter MgtE [Flavobacteriaceae bacterium UJ101]
MSDVKNISPEFIENLLQNIKKRNNKAIIEAFSDMHPADIAEILDDFELEDEAYVLDILDNDLSSDIFIEIDDDDRKKILQKLTSKEIAESVIKEIDSDDAADIIAELPEEQKEEVIAELDDVEQAKDIVELLRYDEDTAGGLMGKELIKVNQDWNVLTCVKEMRKQAEELEQVNTIYVVDVHDILLGTLSLKKLLTTSTRTKVEEIYRDNIRFVSVKDSDVEVANVMSKYDLYEIPVVDEMNRLVGRISIDDVVDVIKEEAEKDYQLASGISQDVDSDDTIWKLTKARLPWLVLGLFGGLASARIMGGFDEALARFPELFFFTPLIAAMAGNVGVQSSAIIVQAIANDDLKGKLSDRLLKEFGLSLVNGFVLSGLVILFGGIIGFHWLTSLTIAISLMSVIILAGFIGTLVPIVLHNRGIDPALATGPFITTSNDILGILLYFLIAKMVLGF